MSYKYSNYQSEQGNKFEIINKNIKKYYESYENNLKNFSNSVKEINRLTPKIEEELKEPKNQINELIKRLMLSAIIVSFFLTVLRYIIKLYQSNYNLMVSAENDDLLVRKFYVTLKNTDKNQDERKIVIEKFLDKLNDEGINLPSNLDKANVIKDLLIGLIKKL